MDPPRAIEAVTDSGTEHAIPEAGSVPDLIDVVLALHTASRPLRSSDGERVLIPDVVEDPLQAITQQFPASPPASLAGMLAEAEAMGHLRRLPGVQVFQAILDPQRDTSPEPVSVVTPSRGLMEQLVLARTAERLEVMLNELTERVEAESRQWETHLLRQTEAIRSRHTATLPEDRAVIDRRARNALDNGLLDIQRSADERLKKFKEKVERERAAQELTLRVTVSDAREEQVRALERSVDAACAAEIATFTARVPEERERALESLMIELADIHEQLEATNRLLDKKKGVE